MLNRNCSVQKLSTININTETKKAEMYIISVHLRHIIIYLEIKSFCLLSFFPVRQE